jgi:hypothetical protein
MRGAFFSHCAVHPKVLVVHLPDRVGRSLRSKDARISIGMHWDKDEVGMCTLLSIVAQRCPVKWCHF